MISKTMTKIRNIVETCEMKQISLAEKTGRKDVSISRWIGGVRDPKIKDVEAMADALGYEIALVAKKESNMNGVNFGDDINIEGVVKRIENGCIMIETKNGTEIWIPPKDIKTHRPKIHREEDDLK